jgi:predicted deacetylase
MSGRARTPWEWAWAQGFARNQGEMFLCNSADTERRLEAALAIFRRAGLDSEVRGFVPPAWLLSPEALAVIRRADFGFYELMSGIVHRDALQARRLIGFGSLSWPEARVTAGFARFQLLRPPADTRFAIHPADLELVSSVAAIKLTLRRLLDQLVPMNYTDFLRHAA